MGKEERQEMRKKILVKALSKNLNKAAKSPLIRSIKDGKDLICPYCNRPIQPCKSDPSAMCEQMLLSGTDGKEIEEALKNISISRYGICICCGKPISTKHLKKHATAEICVKCTNTAKKLKTKKIN